MPSKRKLRRRRLKKLAREGYRYKNRLYFCSAGPKVFYYANIDYITGIQYRAKDEIKI